MADFYVISNRDVGTKRLYKMTKGSAYRTELDVFVTNKHKSSFELLNYQNTEMK